MIIRWKLLLSLALFTVLGFQLLRSIRIDAYELSGGRVDIFGYWFCLIASLVLVLNYVQSRRLHFPAIVLTLLFLGYATVVIIFTDQDKSIISFLVSRYGLLMWLFIGLGFGVMLRIFESSRNSGSDRAIKKIFLMIILAQSALIASFSLSYIASPVFVSTESYQSVATSASILLVIEIISIEALWGAKKPPLLIIGYLVVGTLFVGAIVLMQSTLIIAVWGGLIVLYLWNELLNSRWIVKFLIMSFAAVGVMYIAGTETFERIAINTRFNVFFGSDGEFSSIASRQSILETFWNQFTVSPVFGHYRAEVISGVGHGEFVHSLPLSFLTHTGLVGGALISTSFYLVIRNKIITKKDNMMDTHIARLMIIVVLIGTISTFLTWALFWFLLGVLCQHPIRVKERI